MNQVATEITTEHRMNPEVKTLWVARLRSGMDLQGEGALCAKHNDKITRMCCLGVLTDIFIHSDANVAKLDWEPNESNPKNRCTFDGDNALISPRIMKWAGLADCMGGPIEISNGMRKFYGMNASGLITLPILNDFKVPFEIIADIIEQQR